MRLGSEWANRISVIADGDRYTFYIWDEQGITYKKVATVLALSGQDRENQAATERYIELYKTDTVIYVAALESCAYEYGLNEVAVRDSFRLIQQDWKTGET